MELRNLTDGELLDLLKKGDQEAFNAIYHRHCTPLYSTALRILEDRDAAKDVVQETFISFFEKARKSAIQNLPAYLFQSVKNLCFMQLRSGRISEKHLNRINTLLASNAIEEEVNANELQLALDESLATLPEKCREVFYLSRFESLSNKKIAERLNISHKTVENQITKALKVLHMSIDKLVLIGFVQGFSAFF